MARITITGAAGFIGANLSRGLLHRGYDVVGLDNFSFGREENVRECLADPRFRLVRGDILSQTDLEQAVDGADLVVHLAAHKIPRYADALDTLIANTEGARLVIEAARRRGVPIIAASTSDVYGRSTALPFREDGDLVVGPPDVRRWAYAISKMYVEQLLFAYHDRFGLDFLILRLFGGYGPFQHLTWWGGPQSVFVGCALTDRSMPIHGDGMQVRCLTYVDDYVEALIRCIEDGRVRNEVLNVGTDEPVTILDLARMCWRLVRDDEPRFEMVPYASFGKYEDVARRIPDLSRLRARIGFVPRTPLAEGLRRTIAWQRDAMRAATIPAPASAAGLVAGRRPRLHFLAPMLNEAGNLARLLHEAAAGAAFMGVDYDVILVDDGSTDNTTCVIETLRRSYPITVLAHPTNRGVGAAFNTGFDYMLDHLDDDDIVVTLEADCTSDLSILPAMARHLGGGADLVLASCYSPGGEIVNTNLFRVLLSRCANTSARVLLGLPGVHTLSSFYRMFRVATLRRLADGLGRPILKRGGFECMLEMLAGARVLGLRLAEVPMVLDLSKRRGASKMRLTRTIGGYLALYMRHLAGRRFRRPAAAPVLSLADHAVPARPRVMVETGRGPQA